VRQLSATPPGNPPPDVEFHWLSGFSLSAPSHVAETRRSARGEACAADCRLMTGSWAEKSQAAGRLRASNALSLVDPASQGRQLGSAQDAGPRLS